MVDFHWLRPDWDDRKVEALVAEYVANGRYEYPAWKYPMLPAYNGCSGEARVRGWQIAQVAKAMGLIPWPKQCSVCGTTTGKFHSHNEDYTHPCNARPVCAGCHRTIHSRFKYPKAWLALVAEHGGLRRWPITMWFENLSMVPLARGVTPPTVAPAAPVAVPVPASTTPVPKWVQLNLFK